MMSSPIVTLTFSPCIDKSTVIDQLLPEKKLRCAEPVLEAGGGGINVARAISHLGGKAFAVFPSGGYTGKQFNHLLSLEHIPVHIIETKEETRENIVVLDRSTNNQYRFGMPGTRLHETEWKQCLEAIESMDTLTYLVASGSLPPGVPTDVYAQLARLAKRKNARLMVDTSGEALKNAVQEGVFLLKPNLGELASLLGVNEITETSALNYSRKLIGEGKCVVLLLSMGAAGAMLVTQDEGYRIIPPVVEKKSTVGAGDSMVAGFLYSLWKGASRSEAARYAVACGTAATLNEGTALCNKADVETLLPLVKLEPIF